VISRSHINAELIDELTTTTAQELRLFKGHLSWTTASCHISDFDQALKISILRDPVDRAISLYQFHRRHSIFDVNTMIGPSQYSHVLYAKAFELMDILSDPAGDIWIREYTRMFSQLLTDEEYAKEPGEIANLILNRINLIGFQENLMPFANAIKSLLWNDLSIDYPLGRERSSPGNSTELAVNMKELVINSSGGFTLFKKDISIYSILKCVSDSNGGIIEMHHTCM